MTPTRTPSHAGRTVVLTTVSGVVLATVSALSGATAQAAPAPAASAATPNYLGDAYGSTATVGTVVTSGRSAPVVLGCGSKAGISRTNASAGLALAPLATSGTVATTASTEDSPLTSATTARTEQVSLLGGLVSATAVEAASATTRSGSSFSTSPAGTTFANLKIGTQRLPANPAANTRVDLPAGLGYVVLNEQKATNTTKGASLEVNALHLVVTKQNLLLGATAGVNVVVSHARSGLTAPVAGVLGGSSYGTRLTVGSVVASGSTFQRVMPCTGTNGAVKTNTGAGTALPDLLTLGVVTDTAKGTVNDRTATGETTSTVAASNLLAGVLQATVVKADAHATKVGGKRTFGDSGSSFGSLSVQGHPEVTANVPANTEIALPGLGTLYLHRVIRTGNKIEVCMVELVLSSPTGGLPAGADLRVAVAAASVR